MLEVFSENNFSSGGPLKRVIVVIKAYETRNELLSAGQ